MYSITKEFRFEAAHRLMLHKGACANIHGHSYRVEVVIEAPEVNENGMVRDFGDLALFKERIAAIYDHKILLNLEDPLARVLWSWNSECKMTTFPTAPTAENLAREMYEWLTIRFRGVRSVTVWETEKCSATYTSE